MFSNSGFPFAPDYLNTLRLGPTVKDEISPRKRGPKSKKRSTFSIERTENEPKAKNTKIKATKTASTIAVLSDIPFVQLPVRKVLETAADNADQLSAIPNTRGEVRRDRNLSEFQSEISMPSALRYDDSNLSIILRVSKADVKAISGYCLMTLLKGCAVLNGYDLCLGERVEIINSSWLPAAILSAGLSPSPSPCSMKTGTKRSVVNILENLDLPVGSNASNVKFCDWISDSETLVLVQGFSKDKQEWLQAAEDQSMYQEFSRPDYSGDVNCEKMGKKWWMERLPPGSDSVFGVVSAVIGDSCAVSKRLSVELLDLPSSWATSVTDILKESSKEECRHSRTVICGAKGVGKSTCVRHTVNQLLSRTDAVAVIDCDLGQPEFTVPGLLSLHIISKPILSPTHMHLHEPILSYFIGDLTSKNEPELFSTALSALVAKYSQLQHNLLEERMQSRVRAECEINSFSLLDNKKEIMEMVPLPLVVNTDGSVRYMGAEVLSAVMELVDPTHVLHISSEKDRDLPAVVVLRDVPCKAPFTPSSSDGGSCNNSFSGALVTDINDRNSDIKIIGNIQHRSDILSSSPSSSSSSTCRVFTLEPGRLRASKIHSVDLRTLRIVSYFLRGETSLRSKVRAEQAYPLVAVNPKGSGDDTYGPKGLASSNSMSSLQSESAMSEDGEGDDREMERAVVEGTKKIPATPKISKRVLALMAGEGFHIRRGALVDTAGAIALKFMGSTPLGVKFSEIILRVQLGGIPPRLMLAAINGSMVGIVHHPSYHPDIQASQQYSSYSSCRASSSSGSRIRRVRLRAPQTKWQGIDTREEPIANAEELDVHVRYIDGEEEREEKESMRDFDIYCDMGDISSESPDELSVCIGLGIVRSIDIEKQLVHLVTPLDPCQLNSIKGRISLVRGQLQIPSIMLYAPELMSVHPYMSSEITGEGSAAMKARNNVKRRSQQS